MLEKQFVIFNKLLFHKVSVRDENVIRNAINGNGKVPIKCLTK